MCCNVQLWIMFLGAFGIVVGLATYGYTIIRAIGVKLCKITPSRGFSIELGSALVVATGSYYALPLSTTHCQVLICLAACSVLVIPICPFLGHDPLHAEKHASILTSKRFERFGSVTNSTSESSTSELCGSALHACSLADGVLPEIAQCDSEEICRAPHALHSSFLFAFVPLFSFLFLNME
jgi:hypothetical protein